MILLKHQNRTQGQEELPRYPEETLAAWELGEVKSRGSFQRGFHMLKKTHRILEA